MKSREKKQNVLSPNLKVRHAVSRVLSMAASASLFAASSAAIAGPEGGAVVHGTATITSGASATRIDQTSDRAVINWRSFSIGANERVDFNQPSSTSATLNRVTGAQRSVIEGALSANGKVFLLNSSGVLFAPGAKVDVGGLVATTSALRDEDFMADRLTFTAAAAEGASVVNQGTISIQDGGIAALVAPTVRNEGVISARLGRVALGGGESFTLDLYGDQMINFALPGSGAESGSPTVDQSGSLIADGGRVWLTTQAASNVVGGVVNMSGVVQARSASQDATGSIVLAGEGADINVSGTLDASGTAAGTQGGLIEAYGSRVRVSDGALVDASGAAGGGTVRIGGGLAGEATPRAQVANIAAGATIDVSAKEGGNGGTVAVWGTDEARFAGTIHAGGGSAYGDGGFVEVSSKGLLQFLGEVFSESANGATGRVLLDPETIRVEHLGSSDPTSSVIAASALNNLLRQGTTVELLADNLITVNAAIDGRSATPNSTSGGLSLTAGRVILMQPLVTQNAPITIRATTGDITFGANAYVFVSDSATGTGIGNGAISLDAATSVSAGQLISLGTVNVRARAGDVTLNRALYGLAQGSGSTGIGALQVNADAGSISLRGAKSSGTITLVASNAITNTEASLVGTSVSVTTGAGGFALRDVAGGAAVAGIDATTGPVTIATTAPGAIELGSGIRTNGASISIGSANQRVRSVNMAAGTSLQTIASAASPQNGSISIFSNGPVTAQALVAGQAGAVTIDANGANGVAGDVTLGSSISGLTGVTTQVGSLTVNAAGTVQTLGATTGGNISLTGATVTNTTSPLVAGGNVALTATAAGGITLAALESTTDSDDIPEAAIDAGGNVTFTTPAAGAVTLNSSVLSRGGDVTLGSTNQRVALTMAENTFIQSVASGTATDQDGAIRIFSNGATSVQELIAGRSGAVEVNATGALTLNDGVYGLTNPAGAATPGDTSDDAFGIGSLTLTSTGAVSLRGAGTAGALSVTSTGAITNAAGVLRTGGTATLTANGGGAIDLGAQGGLLSTGANANVTLATTGAVNLGAGIATAGGDITVGTATNPVASIDGVNASLLTYNLANPTDRDGAVNLYATGGVNVRRVLGGLQSLVNIRGSSVRTGDIIDGIEGGVGGVNVAATTAAATTPGVFSYDIDFRGARVAGATGVSLVVPNAGDIAVRGPIGSAGPVVIGLATGVAPNDPNNARVNLSNNIYTADQTVTVNGNVTLFEDIDRWSLERALEGIPAAGDPYIDTSLFLLPSLAADPEAVVNRQAPSLVDPNDPLSGPRDLTLQFEAPDLGNGAYLVFRHDPGGQTITYTIDGSTDVTPPDLDNDGNPDPITVTVGPGQTATSPFRFLSINSITPSAVDPNTLVSVGIGTVPGFGASQSHASVCTPNCDVESPTTLAVPYEQQQRFLQSGTSTGRVLFRAIGTDANGNAFELPEFSTSGCLNNTSGWACGYNASNSSALNERAQALQREKAISHLLGVLTASIDTADNGAGGANIQINGNVRRPTPVAPVVTENPGDNATGIVAGLLSHGFDVRSGDGTLNITGRIGDVGRTTDVCAGLCNQTLADLDPQFAVGAASIIYGFDGDLPTLGGFFLSVDSNAATNLDNDNLYFVAGERSKAVDLASRVQNDSQVYALQYMINVPWTQSDIGSPKSSTFTQPNWSPNLTFTSIGGSSAGASATLAGAQAAGLGTPSGAGTQLTPIQEFVFNPPGTIESTTHEDESGTDPSDAKSAAAPQNQDSDNSCPRGAGQLADLGDTRSVDGAAPDVFERCKGS